MIETPSSSVLVLRVIPDVTEASRILIGRQVPPLVSVTVRQILSWCCRAVVLSWLSCWVVLSPSPPPESCWVLLGPTPTISPSPCLFFFFNVARSPCHLSQVRALCVVQSVVSWVSIVDRVGTGQVSAKEALCLPASSRVPCRSTTLLCRLFFLCWLSCMWSFTILLMGAAVMVDRLSGKIF